MKSERAKQFIDGMSVTIEADGNRVISQSTVVGIWDVYIAINIAEQDAEARMRDKAIQAYCSECSCYETGVCALDPDKCATKLLFVEKLTEK